MRSPGTAEASLLPRLQLPEPPKHGQYRWWVSRSRTWTGRSTSSPECSTSAKSPTPRCPGLLTRLSRQCPEAGSEWCGSGWVTSSFSSRSTSLAEGRPFPADSRSNDRWFQHVAIIVSDMGRAYARLEQFKVRRASTAPQLLPKTIPNAAGIRAFYFRDPDGHFLEILQFPPDKGDPKWQRTNGRLFLGIDHTAIVVRQTNASLRFYRDALGLRVAGESMNFGTEQAHLNNVEGARLHITGLRAGDGPGIEFLQYLNPTDGRAYPADERANDLVHWQTTIVVPNVVSAAALLRRDQFRLLSPTPAELPDTTLGFKRGILARDPDGHVVQLVES